MSKKDWSCHDVAWHVPGRKTPIAYSTRATSDMIQDLADQGFTLAESRRRLLYDDEGQAVLDEYIKRGFGDSTKGNLDSMFAR